MNWFKNEYRLNHAFVTSLYWAYADKKKKKDRRVMVLHGDIGGRVPDISFITDKGQLWLCEIKKGKINRRNAIRMLCQLLCYASEYREKTPNELAELYCKYMKKLLDGFQDKQLLNGRFEESDKFTVLKEDFKDWFEKSCSDIKFGGEIERLEFIAADWDQDAKSLFEKVRLEGIQKSIDILSENKDKNIKKVIDFPEKYEAFCKAEWILRKYLPPDKWVNEIK
ncbi:MAG: hypothetical protein NT009_08295 [Proteobacteria bacterium]|nr:hypothetical protein [Pseudomonadota bacterium]